MQHCSLKNYSYKTSCVVGVNKGSQVMTNRQLQKPWGKTKPEQISDTWGNTCRGGCRCSNLALCAWKGLQTSQPGASRGLCFSSPSFLQPALLKQEKKAPAKLFSFFTAFIAPFYWAQKCLIYILSPTPGANITLLYLKNISNLLGANKSNKIPIYSDFLLLYTFMRVNFKNIHFLP